MLGTTGKRWSRAISVPIFVGAATLCGSPSPVASIVASITFVWVFFWCPYWLVSEVCD